mmetsp:Transcript_73364/g.143958  ORF Transcript_73364/g.143958 Transcript_73364/m.143958 type:complete len:110 (+) Transcript_73364:66-395(+)
MSYLTCAKCCTFFSISGIIFLVIMGSLLQSQPLYIKGPTDHVKASKGCYEGALLYLVTLLLSVGYWMFDSLRKKPSVNGPNGSQISRSNSNLETTRFGGKYGAVVNDTF